MEATGHDGLAATRAAAPAEADTASGTAVSGADTPAPTGARARRTRRRASLATLVALTKAVADVDPVSIESTAERFGNSRPYLAPIAWAAGTFVLLLRGVTMLIMNWRLLLIQLLPAAWVWIVMYDLKQHTLRGSPFRDLHAPAVIALSAICVASSIAAFWCNTVFAFAIDGPQPPLIRPAARKANQRWGAILAAGVPVGILLAGAAVVVPRLDRFWLYVACLGAVLTIMILSFVAVPAHIIGKRQQKLPPKQAFGRTATGWAVSAVAMTPGFLLDRLGLLLIGVPGFHVIGFLILSVGTALYAAGMSTVKAVKISIKLGTQDGGADTDGGPASAAGSPTASPAAPSPATPPR